MFFLDVLIKIKEFFIKLVFGIKTVLETIWKVFANICVVAACDFMKLLPKPFDIFPDSFVGFLLFLGFIVMMVAFGIGGGYLAKLIFRKLKVNVFWYGFATGFIIPFISLCVLRAVL